MQITKHLASSPMQSIKFANRSFYIKRDDLLNQHFSGNKARKFAYYLVNKFTGINKVIAYGSIQANSLYSLAALCQIKGWQLDYYVHRLPHWLKDKPIGNYAGALSLGAHIIEVDDLSSNLDTYMHEKAKNLTQGELFIPEGGRSPLAKLGIKQLADELIAFCNENALADPIIMLPSGTGTSALFLQHHLPFKVMTCACVGGDEYLKTQFSELIADQTQWPCILPTKKKYHFGKLYPEFFDIWQQLLTQTQIEFDLLYDPLGWQTLLAHLNNVNAEQTVIYIHQGGLVGNQSMLPRYQRKFLNK